MRNLCLWGGRVGHGHPLREGEKCLPVFHSALLITPHCPPSLNEIFLSIILNAQQESLLYFPSIGGVPRHPSENPRRYRSPSEHNIPFETHMVKCADGIAIHSWLLYHPDNAQKRRVPTIIWFHGNAGNIGLRLPQAMQMFHYLKANVWMIEYRGYGDSNDARPNPPLRPRYHIAIIRRQRCS